MVPRLLVESFLPRKKPWIVRRRSTASPYSPSPPVLAPSSGGRERRTLHPQRGRKPETQSIRRVWQAWGMTPCVVQAAGGFSSCSEDLGALLPCLPHPGTSLLLGDVMGRGAEKSLSLDLDSLFLHPHLPHPLFFSPYRSFSSTSDIPGRQAHG